MYKNYYTREALTWINDYLYVDSDPYYAGLYEWFGESFAYELCQEILDEMGGFKDIYSWIDSAQWMARDRILHVVNEFLEENKEENNT